MKGFTYDVATKEHLFDAFWRWEHGFDNIDPQPKGWPIIAEKK